MKTNSIILLILSIVVLNILNCKQNKILIVNPTKDNTLTLNDTLSVAFHDTLFNYEENIWISFDSLITDSRCPIGLNCKWEGNAKVSFLFNSKRFNLNTYELFTNDTTISNYRIYLIDVFPYPRVDSLYTVDQYFAEIVVRK